VATCSDDGLVKIWNSLSNWNLIRTYTGHSGAVYGLEWINSDTIASGGYIDGTIKIWSISSGLTNRTINTGSYVTSLQLLSNGNDMAAGLCSYINIYNINTGSLVATLQGHTYCVRDLVLINNNGNLLASSSDENIARIWDLTTYTSKFTLNGHTNSLRGLKQISSDILASGSADSTVRLWNITSGRVIRTLTGHSSSVLFSVDFLNNPLRLVSGSNDQTIKIWNFTTGECLNTIQTNLYIRSLAVLDRSKKLSFFIELKTWSRVFIIFKI
jgi:WD40 repeat protein